MAYEIRLVLHGIYEWKDVEEAWKLFGNWCAWVHSVRLQTGDLPESVTRDARLNKGRLLGFLAYWRQG
jgi:hypothetical protein